MIIFLAFLVYSTVCFLTIAAHRAARRGRLSGVIFEMSMRWRNPINFFRHCVHRGIHSSRAKANKEQLSQISAGLDSSCATSNLPSWFLVFFILCSLRGDIPDCVQSTKSHYARSFRFRIFFCNRRATCEAHGKAVVYTGILLAGFSCGSKAL